MLLPPYYARCLRRHALYEYSVLARDEARMITMDAAQNRVALRASVRALELMRQRATARLKSAMRAIWRAGLHC